MMVSAFRESQAEGSVCASAAPLSGAKQRGAGADSSPRAVTRGESPRVVQSEQVAKVDWLNATFAGPENYTPGQFVSLFSRVIRRPITGIDGRGLFGFEHAIKLFAGVGSRQFAIGALAYGGEQQRGRWMLQLTGAGCQVVDDWSKVRRLLKSLDARVTRLDLCIDFLEGQYGVDDCIDMYQRGEFNSCGRPPSSQLIASLDKGSPDGRTLYVGKIANGKGLRCYEKGKQLGNAESPWCRFEVQFGNRDRTIPLDALVERDAYLAGAYPALERMFEAAAVQIKTHQTAGHVALGHLMFHLKRSYGKALDVVAKSIGVESDDLVEAVRVIGTPRRLQPSAVACGLTWAQLLAQFNQRV